METLELIKKEIINTGYIEDVSIGSYFHMKHKELYNKIIKITNPLEKTYKVNLLFRGRVLFVMKYNCDLSMITNDRGYLTFDRKIDDFIDRNTNYVKQGWNKIKKNLCDTEVFNLSETKKLVNDMSNDNILFQPIINLGTLGSVSDGKSTLIQKLTGKSTQTHSSELKRNITIKAGYANLKIWYCSECELYLPSNSEPLEYNCTECDSNCNLIHHISFVDSPGHQNLILTMMGSVSLIKGAIVVVSAAESIKQKPQLIQHLAAAKLAKIDKLIICFNKIDLITKELDLAD
jgi:hypothetical protein